MNPKNCLDLFVHNLVVNYRCDYISKEEKEP